MNEGSSVTSSLNPPSLKNWAIPLDWYRLLISGIAFNSIHVYTIFKPWMLSNYHVRSKLRAKHCRGIERWLTIGCSWLVIIGWPLGAMPICCMSAFFSARWFRPLIRSWSFRCCGGWKYLHGGFSRLQRPWKQKTNRLICESIRESQWRVWGVDMFISLETTCEKRGITKCRECHQS